MPTRFDNSLFSTFLMQKANLERSVPMGIMGGVSGSRFNPDEQIRNLPVVVFDFETTGLNSAQDRIIEVGAIRYEGGREVAQISQLINPGRQISSRITEVTGLKNEDLVDQPPIQDVLPKLHDLMRGALLVAHNADFDISFLQAESQFSGISCDYTTLCTLKMARSLLPELGRYNLDTLAEKFSLTFESRHRSIGDIKVTAGVLWGLLEIDDRVQYIQNIQDFLSFPSVS